MHWTLLFSDLAMKQNSLLSVIITLNDGVCRQAMIIAFCFVVLGPPESVFNEDCIFNDDSWKLLITYKSIHWASWFFLQLYKPVWAFSAWLKTGDSNTNPLSPIGSLPGRLQDTASPCRALTTACLSITLLNELAFFGSAGDLLWCSFRRGLLTFRLHARSAAKSLVLPWRIDLLFWLFLLVLRPSV